MSLSRIHAEWIDYYFGDRRGDLEKVEVDKFLSMAQKEDVLIDLFLRAQEWETFTEKQLYFGGLPATVQTAQHIFTELTGTDNVMDATDWEQITEQLVPTTISSALIPTLSEGAMLLGGTLFGHSGLNDYPLYPDMLLESFGADAGDYEKIHFNDFPYDSENTHVLPMVWQLMQSKSGKVKIDGSIDPAKPWIVYSLPTGGMRDLFIKSGDTTVPFEINPADCFPAGNTDCPTSVYTQNTVNETLPVGMTVRDVARGKDLMIFLFPDGNTLKMGLYQGSHQFPTDEAIVQTERLLKETEQAENPPMIAIAMLGSPRPYVRPDALGNAALDTDTCYTYPMRAHAQEVTPKRAAHKQKTDICPVTSDDIEQVWQGIQQYNARLLELQAKYPNLIVINLADFFNSLIEDHQYTVRATGETKPFDPDDIINIDAVHFNLAFHPMLANEVIYQFNRTLGMAYPFVDEDIPVPEWIQSPSNVNYTALELLEESRRKFYKNQ